MPKKLVTPPTEEPVTLQEALDFLRLTGPAAAADSAFVEGLIPVGREHVEDFTGRALMPQSWDAYFDDFIERDPRFKTGLNINGTNVPVPYAASSRFAQLWPRNSYLELPLPPVQEVTSIEYFDPSGTLQTLDPSIYRVDLVTEPARVYIAPGKAWPPYQMQRNAIVVHCVCGYANATVVPAKLKLAVKMVVDNFYENREPVSLVPGTQPYEMPLNIAEMLAHYMTDRF